MEFFVCLKSQIVWVPKSCFCKIVGMSKMRCSKRDVFVLLCYVGENKQKIGKTKQIKLILGKLQNTICVRRWKRGIFVNTTRFGKLFFFNVFAKKHKTLQNWGGVSRHRENQKIKKGVFGRGQSEKIFASQERVSGFPEKGADLRGSPGNFRGSLGNFRGSLGNFRGTPGLLLSSTVREPPGK